MAAILSVLMRSVTTSLSLLVCVAPMLWGCQQQQATSIPDPVGQVQQKRPAIDPTRALWRKEKAEIFAEVEKCVLSPSEAIRKLEKRRAELSPSVKDGRGIGFRPAKVNQIASQAGCPGL